MSYEVKFSGNGTLRFAYFGSYSDVEDFDKWVMTLDEEVYPDLRAFTVDGETLDTEALKEQIDHALSESPPDADSAVGPTARHLLELIGDGDENETVAIIDREDDESDEE